MVVSALLALAVAGTAGVSETCPHAPSGSAYLAGESAPVEAIGAALRRRGVEAGAPACSTLRVTVTRHDGKLRVERQDPTGSAITREVATPDTAAALIESWLRTDIAAPLLLALAEPLAPPPAPAPPPPSPASDIREPGAPETAAAAVLTAAPPVERGSLAPALALVGEAAVAPAGAHAFGLGLASCVNLGPVCAGLAGHLARVSVTGSGDAVRESDGAYAADALMAAELPWRLGRATLRPGAAVGAGWVGARGALLERHQGTLDAVGVRAEARVAMDVRLGGGVALEVAAAGGAAGSSAVQETMTMAGGGGMTARERVTLDRRLVPMVRAGLGLRFGGAVY